MLGSPPRPVDGEERRLGRFESKVDYCQLIQSIFSESAAVLHEDAVVYVRTDARDSTRETTEVVLRTVFPCNSMEIIERPYAKNKMTQTSLFGDKTTKPGEVDIILRPH